MISLAYCKFLSADISRRTEGKHENISKNYRHHGRESIRALPVQVRIPHFLDNRLTVNCEILATCSSTYSPVRTSQEAHSVSIK
jgi:hypothetical protein